MKAIIFGINGQDGFYLQKLFIELNIEVVGVSRNTGTWIIGNVADRIFVEDLIGQHKPDYIFHLAANSTTRHDVIFENHETISTGTLNILEAVFRYSLNSKVFLSGSGLQFVNKELPISEKDPFDASSAYCVARIQSVYAARYYRTLGLKIYIGYFFNHDSPLRTDRHINQKIIATIKKIITGSNEVIEIGDLNTKKEFNFAQDLMEAIWVLVNQDEIFEAVIGSGNAYSIKDWIQICFDKVQIDWKKYVVEKNNFISEYKILVSDPSTIYSLGWKPKVDIYKLAEIMLSDGE